MRTFLFMMPLVGIDYFIDFFSAIEKVKCVLSLSKRTFIIPLMLILPLFGGIEMILFAGRLRIYLLLIAVVLIFVEFKKMKPHKSKDKKKRTGILENTGRHIFWM